jgi:hypothetical protein
MSANERVCGTLLCTLSRLSCFFSFEGELCCHTSCNFRRLGRGPWAIWGILGIVDFALEREAEGSDL